jgi:hypothetical protein
MSSQKEGLFPLLDWILKKESNLCLNMDLPSTFIVNRWLSMCSIENSLIINETLNRWSRNYSFYSDICSVSKFLRVVLPKNNKRISYIKKKKTKIQEKNTSDDVSCRECSKREIIIQNKLIEEFKRLTK